MSKYGGLAEASRRIERALIAGATGAGYGHAKMHALQQALVDHRAEFNAAGLKVLTCQEKPFCFQRSVVLGLAGISSGEETYKSKKPMGSTEWGVSSTLSKLQV